MYIAFHPTKGQALNHHHSYKRITTIAFPSDSSNEKSLNCPPIHIQEMVNLTSTIATLAVCFAALASAAPTLEKRGVTCRDDLDPKLFGKVSQASEKKEVTREPETH
jgi:hypothetical protein